MIKLGGLIDACPVGNNMYRLPGGSVVDSKTYLALEREAHRREMEQNKSILDRFRDIFKKG